MESKEDDTSLEISELETYFVPEEGEIVHEVIEITGENARQYKVKWKGTDKKTNRPWPQEWVPKHDCTEGLVLDWKKKKARRVSVSRISKGSRSKSTTQGPSTKALSSRRGRTTEQADSFWDDPAGHSVKKRKTGGPTRPSRETKRRKVREVRASEDGSAAEAQPSDIDEKPPGKSHGRGRIKIAESKHREGRGLMRNKGKEKEVEDGEHRSFSPPLPRRRSARTHALRLHKDTPVDNSVGPSDDSPGLETVEKPSPTRSNTRASQENDLEQNLGFHQPVLLLSPTLIAHVGQNSKAEVVATCHVSPLLSPGAVARLKEYDDFCRDIDEEEQRMRAEGTDNGSPVRLRSPQASHGALSHSGHEKNGTTSALPLPNPSELPSPDQESPQPRAIRTRPKNAVDASEIVPETETQSSTDTHPPPPERVTLVSKMKPRSTSKANVLSSPQRSLSLPNERGGPSHDKSLKPVPVVSPSRFVPYLQTFQPGRDNEEDVDDTIEQFSSPEKGSTTKALSARSRKEAQVRKDRQDSAKVQEEGLAMSEKARSARVRAQNGGEPKKKTLSQVAKSARSQHSGAEEDEVVLDPSMEDLTDDHLISEGPNSIDFHYNDQMATPDLQDPSVETDANSPVSLKSIAQLAADPEVTRIREKLKEELENASNKITLLEDALANERSERNLQRELAETLREKNELICRLETSLAVEKEEKQVLFTKIGTLEETLVAARSATLVSSDPPPDAQVTTGVVEELKAALDKVQSDKTSLEKDRDFFREEWSKASGFVTEVRKENIVLEQRVQVAEGQAKEGVAMVKATFQDRIKFLEDNAKQAHTLASFIMEKDKRTNDDIRKRAAEQPELRKRIEELDGELESRDLQIEALEASLKSARTENEKRVEAWKAEVVRITKDLNVLKAERVRTEQNHDDPDKQVFRCMLMDEKGQGLCPYHYDTPEEIEDHIYYHGHLS